MHSFTEKLHSILLGDGYQVIPTDIENVRMYGFLKGKNLYLLNVIYLHENFKISLEQYDVYKKVTEEQFKPHGYGHIYLLNIFISDEINELYHNLSKRIPDYDEYLIDFQWLIDIEKKELHIPKDQPNHFLNINPIVKSVLGEKDYKTKPEIKYKTNRTYITMVLIIVNVFIWLLMEAYGSSMDHFTLIRFGALFSPYIQFHNEYYRLFTAMFLHIGFTHLFYNMFALYLFGSRIEKVLGPIKFIGLYIFAGLAGSLLSYGTAVAFDGLKLAAGASGAIYGLQGAALYTTMRSRGGLDGLSEGFLWVMTLGGLIFGFVSNNVDNMAHLGGLVTGYILMILLTLRLNMNKKAA